MITTAPSRRWSNASPKPKPTSLASPGSSPGPDASDHVMANAYLMVASVAYVEAAQLRGERRNPKKARWAPSHTSATPAKGPHPMIVDVRRGTP